MEVRKDIKMKCKNSLYLIILVIIVSITLFSCRSGQKFDIERDLKTTNDCFKSNLEILDNSVHYSNMSISISIDGKLIRSEKLKACMVKNEQDTLKILFSSSGLAGNNLLINCCNGYYESYIEFWSDYDEFNGKGSLILPLNNTSLILNDEELKLDDTINGTYSCLSVVDSEYFEGEVKIESRGCFISLVKNKWE